jgi:hypothetical protein
VHIQHVKRRLQIVQQRAEHLVQTKNAGTGQRCGQLYVYPLIQASQANVHKKRYTASSLRTWMLMPKGSRFVSMDWLGTPDREKDGMQKVL